MISQCAPLLCVVWIFLSLFYNFYIIIYSNEKRKNKIRIRQSNFKWEWAFKIWERPHPIRQSDTFETKKLRQWPQIRQKVYTVYTQLITRIPFSSYSRDSEVSFALSACFCPSNSPLIYSIQSLKKVWNVRKKKGERKNHFPFLITNTTS